MGSVHKAGMSDHPCQFYLSRYRDLIVLDIHRLDWVGGRGTVLECRGDPAGPLPIDLGYVRCAHL